MNKHISKNKSNLAGRHKINLNIEELERVAAFKPTQDELASYFSVSISTIKRRLSEPEYKMAYERGSHTANLSLRRAMWEKAMSGNVTMMIFLAKTQLGIQEGSTVEPVELTIVYEGEPPKSHI